MISKEKAREALQALIGLNDFPANVKRQNTLVKAFQTADNLTIATAAISAWVADSNKCPSPEDIRSIINSLNEANREIVAKVRSRCDACGGTGFIIVKGRNPFSDQAVTGVKDCACRQTGVPVSIQRTNSGCSMCQGHGLFSRQEHGKEGPLTFYWCMCEAGVERREREYREIDEERGSDTLLRGPRKIDSVVEANTARDKLLALGPSALRKFVGLPHSEVYHGEF
jgi:hypothetical protein